MDRLEKKIREQIHILWF